jgi:hypothetical protein
MILPANWSGRACFFFREHEATREQTLADIREQLLIGAEQLDRGESRPYRLI